MQHALGDPEQCPLDHANILKRLHNTLFEPDAEFDLSSLHNWGRDADKPMLLNLVSGQTPNGLTYINCNDFNRLTPRSCEHRETHRDEIVISTAASIRDPGQDSLDVKIGVRAEFAMLSHHNTDFATLLSKEDSHVPQGCPYNKNEQLKLRAELIATLTGLITLEDILRDNKESDEERTRQPLWSSRRQDVAPLKTVYMVTQSRPLVECMTGHDNWWKESAGEVARLLTEVEEVCVRLSEVQGEAVNVRFWTLPSPRIGLVTWFARLPLIEDT